MEIAKAIVECKHDGAWRQVALIKPFDCFAQRQDCAISARQLFQS
jgi:hypothetical protein